MVELGRRGGEECGSISNVYIGFVRDENVTCQTKGVWGHAPPGSFGINDL